MILIQGNAIILRSVMMLINLYLPINLSNLDILKENNKILRNSNNLIICCCMS